jgi:phenylpyruvate tautomerase PptA (4-oxalocrotonate tautomerase family)
VIFNEVKPGNYYLGGKPLEDDQIFVHGTIRDGRSDEIKNDLMACLLRDVSAAADIPANRVWVYVAELSASQMIEFGYVLPTHGKEAAWTEALPATERERLQNIGIRRER